MNKKVIVPATLTLAAALMLSGCGNKEETNEPMAVDEAETSEMPICDENGNVYASEEEAAATGLSEAQYGATYCGTTDEVDMTVTKEVEKTTTPVADVKKTTTTVETDSGAVQKKTTEVTPSESFSKKEQTTGSKKHDDFILEHVKHNDAGSKYVVAFKLDRKHDAKTHEAPYTVATYHPHDTDNNNGRIEVEIHEVDKNTFDPTKIIEPKHNKYVKDIVMEDSGHDNRALFVIHLDEKATGKFNLSSNVANNQDATITLDVLE